MSVFEFLIFLAIVFCPSESTEKDVVFLIQTPDHLTADDRDSLTRFVYNVTERLVIGPNDTLVSVITYLGTHVVKFNKTDFISNDTLLPEIENLRTSLGTLAGAVMTSDVITYLQNTAGIYDRKERYLVLIMFDVSASPGQVAFEMFGLQHITGVNVSVIGIGENLDADSHEPRTIIASKEEYYHYVDNIKYLCWEVPKTAVFIDAEASVEKVPLCPNPNATTTESPKSEEIPYGLIFGTTFGVLTLIVLLLILLLICKKKKKRESERMRRIIEMAVQIYPTPKMERRKHRYHEDTAASDSESSRGVGDTAASDYETSRSVRDTAASDSEPSRSVRDTATSDSESSRGVRFSDELQTTNIKMFAIKQNGIANGHCKTDAKKTVKGKRRQVSRK